MEHLIYVSTARARLTEHELLDMLIQSRQNNLSNKITGMLLYGEGTFMQVIEGENEVLETLYEKLLADVRHKNLIKLVHSPIKQRSFPNWTMAFATVNDDVVKEFQGYVNLASGDFLEETADAPPSVTMLKIFASTNNLTY